MASDVSIANFALRRLGANGISSVTDDPTAEGLIVADTFEEIRDSLLREHTWNFATRRTSLAASANAPDWGFTRAFPIPEDFLRLVEVDGASVDAVKVESQAADGRVLLSDLDAPLRIAYIAKITNAELMDPSFRRALSLRCALEWCEKLTASSTLAQQVGAEYVDALRLARSVDGQEDTPAVYRPNEWVNARV